MIQHTRDGGKIRFSGRCFASVSPSILVWTTLQRITSQLLSAKTKDATFFSEATVFTVNAYEHTEKYGAQSYSLLPSPISTYSP